MITATSIIMGQIAIHKELYDSCVDYARRILFEML